MLKRPFRLVIFENLIDLINASLGYAIPEQGELENILVSSDDLLEYFCSLDVDIVILKVDFLYCCKITANYVLILEKIAV